MNFLVLISAISSLLSTTIIPTSSKSIDHNSIYCYKYSSDWLYSNNIRQAIAELNTNMFFKRRCNKAHNYCGSIIISKPISWLDMYFRHHRIPREIIIKLTCVNNDECSFTQNSSYQDHADYDVPHETHTTECCQGDLCNTLDNLPNTNEFLNSPARNMEAHNEKCPNYSNNYQVIWLDNWENYNQDFIIESGSNLLLSNHHYIKNSIRNSQIYNGTSWLVTRTSDSDKNDVAIIEFNKNGDMNYNEQSQDYIAKNKIFFVTADVMHICNFTKAEGSLTIKHVDKFINSDTVKLVNIILVGSNTTISSIPATTTATTNEVLNYLSKTNTNLFKDSELADNSWKLSVIIIVPTLTTVTIITIAIYKKYGAYFRKSKSKNNNSSYALS